MSFGVAFALPARIQTLNAGASPFGQLGPTLDLVFAGIPTDPLNTLVGTLDLFFTRPLYEIAEAYSVWEIPVGMVAKTFSQIITFTRASSATYFDAAGVLQTATTNVPRFDYNPSTLAAQGFLIEESRTNLITSSAVLPAGLNVTITADTFVAPDGTTTGDQILDNATLGEHYSDSSFTPVAATNYTFSAFIKNIGASSSGFAWLRLAGDFNAFVGVNLSTLTVAVTGGANFVSSSIQAINNGWYKVSVTGLSVGTAATVARVQITDVASLAPYSGTGKGFAVWGRQLEAGAFPTSYIPTTTVAVTRSADVASVNTLAPWFNAAAGTIYTEFVVTQPVSGGNQFLTRLSDNGYNNSIANNVSSTGFTQLVTSSGGVFDGVASVAVAVTANTVTKFAGAYAANALAACQDGGAVATDSTATIPSGLTRFDLGSDHLGLNRVRAGYLRRVTYYPRVLTAAELRMLTLPAGATLSTQDYSLDTDFTGNTVSVGA